MSRGQTVGEVLVDRMKALLDILATEPKHSSLDAAYLAAKEALERMIGTPQRSSGHYTDKGEALVFPAQDGASPNEEWEQSAPVAVPVSELEAKPEVEAEEPADDAK